MKLSACVLPLTGILLLNFSLVACTGLQLQPQPSPLPLQVSSTASKEEPSAQRLSPSPTQANWTSILGSTSAPPGWKVIPCENPALLCVYAKNEIIGTVELFKQPVAGSNVEGMLAQSKGQPVSALKVWVKDFYATIEQDRKIGDKTWKFIAEPPQEVLVGGRLGLIYGFKTTHANGTLVDRTIGYVTTDGTTLYVIATGVVSGDPSGSFATDVDAQTFKPYLAQIIKNLKL